jgi:hypothetical protein
VTGIYTLNNFSSICTSILLTFTKNLSFTGIKSVAISCKAYLIAKAPFFFTILSFTSFVYLKTCALSSDSTNASLASFKLAASLAKASLASFISLPPSSSFNLLIEV